MLGIFYAIIYSLHLSCSKTWRKERRKFLSPVLRVSSSVFRSRRPFGYTLPIASYSTIFAVKWSSNGGLEAVVSKWLAQCHKGLTTCWCYFYFCLSPPNPIFFVIDHTTKSFKNAFFSTSCHYCGIFEFWRFRKIPSFLREAQTINGNMLILF